jgi:site-specific DNA-methyltransferase (adenine-specific)
MRIYNEPYRIIYADPPWKYDNERGNDPAQGTMTYPTMSVEDLSKLKVNDISAKDSLLFMWATMPKLREALAVMDAWGFNYITTVFTWVKLNKKATMQKLDVNDFLVKGGFYSGLGHWTNGNVELVLMGKKGKGVKRVDKKIKQLVFAPVGRHSAKPHEVSIRILKMLGGGDIPRIELFARETSYNWDVWGNEVESSIQL